jgi:multidrug efflux pump subunit AcrA (membrane-fusion protein)
MLSEVEVENPRGEVLPGAYVVVRLRVASRAERADHSRQRAPLPLRGPAVRGGARRRAELVPVKLGRDYGRSVEVSSGWGRRTRDPRSRRLARERHRRRVSKPPSEPRKP